MSILIVDFLPDGIVVAADRNVTARRGAVQGQEQQRQVLKWPNAAAVVGYVGLADVADEPMDDWLTRFIGRHFAFTDLAEVAHALRDEFEQARPARDQNEPVTFHLASFEPGRDVAVLPRCWYITNSTPEGRNIPWVVREELGRREVFGQFREAEWQGRMAKFAQDLAPFWFHQGIDLTIFNTLGAGVKAALKALVDAGFIAFPGQLRDWERFARFQVLTFSAYFEAYKRPYERAVGGGADVVSLPWAHPDSRGSR